MTKKSLTQEYLKKVLDYNPESGVFTRKWRPRSHYQTKRSWKTMNARYAGKEAGNIDNMGYVVIGIDGVKYRAHRLAFLYMRGSFPRFTDHINHDKSDNRWENLRDVTPQDNSRNATRQKRNKSGFTGVRYLDKEGKWYSYIILDGIMKSLGIFRNKDEAIAARKKANINYGFHENHGVL